MTRPAGDQPEAPGTASAVIVNFYGRRGELGGLIGQLRQVFSLRPAGRDRYASGDAQVLLRHFDPVALSAEDTTVVQLALNAAGAITAAWAGMRAQLTAALSGGSVLGKVWGYTLIYQAELAEAGDAVLAALLPAATGLDPGAFAHPQPLAHADLPGGQVWLAGIPLQGEGLQAGSVYLALSEPDSGNRLVREVLYRPDAALLVADLIAHKGYHQIRQYQVGDLAERYRAKVAEVSGRTADVLADLDQQSATSSGLGQLASEYGLLVTVLMKLEELHISLQGIVFNLDWWRSRVGADEIVEFHYGHLRNGMQGLELLMAQAERPLAAAKTAVDMMQARLDKRHEGQQERIETILSAAAAVLSVLVLVDKDTAGSLLELAGLHAPVGVWPELAVQLACVIIASICTLFVIGLIRRRGRSV